MSLSISISMMTMVCLMNLSIQAILSRASNPKKSLVKSCSTGFMALVALSTFQIVLTFIESQQGLISIIIQNLKYLCIFYVPFVLTLFSMKKKGILILIPTYVESVSIVISLEAIFHEILLPYGVLVLIVSTVYFILMLSKYNKIISVWKFDNVKAVSFSDFKKKFLWGILLGICLSSWISMLCSSYIDNRINGIVFGILMIVGGLSLFTVAVLFYLVPTIIAVKRQHLQKVPIILVNILLGWSLIGWVVALVWACMQNKPKVIHMYNESISTDLGEKLKSLGKLRKDGLITDEEYESKKSELLKNY